MADTKKFSQLTEITHSTATGTDYIVGYTTSGDNRKMSLKELADYAINESEAGVDFKESIFDVAPSEETANALLIEESAQTVYLNAAFETLTNLIDNFPQEETAVDLLEELEEQTMWLGMIYREVETA